MTVFDAGIHWNNLVLRTKCKSDLETDSNVYVEVLFCGISSLRLCIVFFLSLFVNNYQENVLGIISAGVADSSFGLHCDEAIVQFVAAGCIFFKNKLIDFLLCFVCSLKHLWVVSG